MSTLVTGIGELVTNDPSRGDGPLGIVAGRRPRRRGRDRRLGRARGGRTGRRRTGSTSAAGP